MMRKFWLASGWVLFIATLMTVAVVREGKRTGMRRQASLLFAGGFRAPAGQTVGDPECARVAQLAWDRVAVADSFPNPDLRNFNRTFRLLNEAFPGDAESTMCHLAKSLGWDLSSRRFPAHLEREFRGKLVELDADEPRERWARDLGYRVKAEVRIDGRLSLVAYWAGSGNATKGFLIEGVEGLFDEGPRVAGYLQWDRTTEEQTLRYFGAEFEGGYLQNAGLSVDPSVRPDRAVFGELFYHEFTGAVAVYSVVMEPQRDTLRHSGQFGCFRVFAKGTKGDAILVAKTEDKLGASGHVRNASFLDGTELDASWVRDNVMTPAGVGRLDYPQFVSLVESALDERPFAMSCNDLYSAGVGMGAFSGTDNDVNFDATPGGIFSMIP